MHPITNKANQLIAYLHNNIILSKEEEVMGVILGNCIFSKGKTIGKIIKNKLHLADGKIIGIVGKEELTNTPNDALLQGKAWTILMNIKDHSCSWIEESSEWDKKNFYQYFN